MHIHILGICGTFMGSLALLARSLGHQVSGSDENVYPPMSTQLAEQGIDLIDGYDNDRLDPEPDLVIVGNAMSRGMPVVERLLNSSIHYVSGPQWLSEALLCKRWVLAVAGTHGKTTTSSMLAWILHFADLDPGYLIGGVPNNFPTSAALGSSPFFVIEADEYDSAFFDKRSKFVHYRPRTTILNNLEFDHADIFPDLEAIKTQFHHMIRTVPENGLLIAPQHDQPLASVLEKGCWTPTAHFEVMSESDKTSQHQQGSDQGDQQIWQAKLLAEDGSRFELLHNGEPVGEINWPLTGMHSVSNGLAAVIAARHAGVTPAIAAEALSAFKSVKRRMEVIYEAGGVTLYDDFAHHPTAIATTLQGLRKKVERVEAQGKGRILAIIEPRSNTMKQGVHQSSLLKSAEEADQVIWFEPAGVDWNMRDALHQPDHNSLVLNDIDAIIQQAVEWVRPSDHVVIMSNGGFGGIHQSLIQALRG